MLYFIIHHAGLELVTANKEFVQHPAIQNDMKRRKKKDILLDLAIHHAAIPSEIRGQKGRPDIVHLSILEYLFSIKTLLAKNFKVAPLVKLYIHTRHNHVLEVPPDWRAPVSYIRFRGLMEKLLVNGQLSTETSIPLQLRNESLETLIAACNPTRIFKCSKDGDIAVNTILATLSSISMSSSESWVILIGGYQRGSVSLPNTHPMLESVSVFDISVPTWKILGFLLDILISDLVIK